MLEIASHKNAVNCRKKETTKCGSSHASQSYGKDIQVRRQAGLRVTGLNQTEFSLMQPHIGSFCRVKRSKARDGQLNEIISNDDQTSLFHEPARHMLDGKYLQAIQTFNSPNKEPAPP